MGITPDVIVLRADEPCWQRHQATRSALFCNVQPGLRY